MALLLQIINFILVHGESFLNPTLNLFSNFYVHWFLSWLEHSKRNENTFDNVLEFQNDFEAKSDEKAYACKIQNVHDAVRGFQLFELVFLVNPFVVEHVDSGGVLNYVCSEKCGADPHKDNIVVQD